MSFLYLTLVRTVDIFPVKQRKMFFKVGLILFVAAVSLYLYATGTVVLGNINRENLNVELEQELRFMQSAEQVVIEKLGVAQEFYVTNGYENANVFDVIKRRPNVAGNKAKLFY